jgi:hypothetical protein
LDELVTVYELALGPTEGEVHFTVGQDTGNRVAEIGPKGIRMVAQQRLDALMDRASHPIMMVKMDVEGYEEEVLRGAQALLANDRLKIIDLEWPTPSIRQTLTRHNFRAAYYDPFSRQLQQEQGNTFSSNNSLFVRDWDFVSARLAAANKIEVLGHSI